MVASPRSDRGFTLIEMLAALLILAFGITTLLGAFSSGIATEQNAELVGDAARLASIVRERVVEGGVLGNPGDALPQPIRDARNARFPGLVYDVDFDPAGEDDRSTVFVKITVRWLRAGSDASETVRFPVPRGRPLWMRLREQGQRPADQR